MTEEHDELFPDEGTKGGSSLSAVLKEEAPSPGIISKSEEKPKKVKMTTKEVSVDDLNSIYELIGSIKSSISGGMNIHRLFLAIDKLESLYKKKLL